jgi:hypothetical protein
MSGGILDYYRNPLATPQSYKLFVHELPRFAACGYDPASTDPPLAAQQSWLAPQWTIAVAILVAGALLQRRRAAETESARVMAAATIAALVIAIVSPGVGQVRFVPWAGLWFCASVAALVLWLWNRMHRAAAIAALVAALAWQSWNTFSMPPEQPIRDAIELADKLAPADQSLLVAFLNADDAVRFYGKRAMRHPIGAAATPPAFFTAQAASLQNTGRLPWLVISFEFIVRDFSPASWTELSQHYRVVARLPGRISPVAIYASLEQAH